MKKLLTIILTISLCIGFIPYTVYGDTITGIGSKSSLKKTNEKKYIEGEAIILLNDDAVSSKSLKSIKSGLKLPRSIEIKDTLTFEGAPDTKTKILTSEKSGDAGPVVINVTSDDYSTEELVEVLEDLPDVKYAEPNYYCYANTASSNEYFGYQWGLENTGQNGGMPEKDINIDKIWTDTAGGTAKSETLVAVLDTGVDYTHRDLKDRMWTNNDTKKLAGKHGYDFSDFNDDPMDDNGHGTHVSGVIGGAGGNENGITGVNKGVKIMALKFLDASGSGELFGALSGYQYIDKALSLGYKVKAVNNSWGGGADSSDIFKTVIDNVGAKGCISVCSAGNAASDNDEYGDFPSAIDSPYIVSVAASNEKGELADFSNYGKESVDIAAPGTSILSSVSYDSYNPTIYSSGKRAELSNFFKGFEDDGDLTGVEWQNWDGEKWTTSKDYPADTTAAIEMTNEDFFGNKDSSSKSMKWTIKKLNSEGMYNLYIPYTTTDSSVPIQMAAAMKIIKGAVPGRTMMEWGSSVCVSDTPLTSDGKLPEKYKSLEDISGLNVIGDSGTDCNMNYWDNMNFYVNPESKAGKKRALVFSFYTHNESSEHEILFDDIGMSKGGNSTDALGKYAFYAGTSMATPAVTGALALLSEAKPDYSPEQLALEIGSMSGGNELTGKVASGGILDMSKYENPKPHILNAKVNGNYVNINGVEFGSAKGDITVNGDAVPKSSVTWKDKVITIPAAYVKDKLVDFKVTTASGKVAAAKIYVVSGKPSFKNEGYIDEAYTGSLTTDGKEMYYAGADGYFGVLLDEDGSKEWIQLAEMDKRKMFPDATSGDIKDGMIFFDTELSYLNGKFYTIASLYTGYSSCYALAAYDVKSDAWIRVADCPGAELTSNKSRINKDFENVDMSSLAAYNGKIYLMGGLDRDTNIASDKVQVYDINAKKWSTGPAMPDGRFLGSARQTGDKLVVSLGGNGKNDHSATCPLIFDGKSWKKGKSIDTPMKNSNYYALTDKDDPDKITVVDPVTDRETYYKAIKYFNAAVGIINGGLVYSGLTADSLGDTYTYSLNSNSYSASPYQYKEKAEDEEMIGIAIGSKFYVSALAQLPELDPFEDEEYEDFGDDGDSFLQANLYSIPVSSGLMSVTAQKAKGKITGTGSYLPGQRVAIKAKPAKKYYFKKMTINGVSTKSKTYTIKAITKKTHIAASFTKYKTKVKLNKTNVTIKAGKSIKLKAKVTKYANKKKGVTWSVSNKKYAKVSKTGKVTVKKAGKGKIVKIYAKAKDGSGAKAFCKIKIK